MHRARTEGQGLATKGEGSWLRGQRRYSGRDSSQRLFRPGDFNSWRLVCVSEVPWRSCPKTKVDAASSYELSDFPLPDFFSHLIHIPLLILGDFALILIGLQSSNVLKIIQVVLVEYPGGGIGERVTGAEDKVHWACGADRYLTSHWNEWQWGSKPQILDQPSTFPGNVRVFPFLFASICSYVGPSFQNAKI